MFDNTITIGHNEGLWWICKLSVWNLTFHDEISLLAHKKISEQELFFESKTVQILKIYFKNHILKSEISI